MVPELDDSKPIFLQVADWLEDGIISGEYAEGVQVPSITEFSVQYKINPATALKGVNILVDEGLLYKKRGVGMFVADGARAVLLQRRKQDFFQAYILPLLEEARRMEINAEELITLIEKGMNQDGN